MVWQRGHEDVPVRITTAASSPQEEISARQRRYVISMSIRTLCFLGAVVVGAGWLRWVLVAAAVLLPYVAVVMANAVGTKSEEFALRDSDFRRGELGTGDENGSTTQ